MVHPAGSPSAAVLDVGRWQRFPDCRSQIYLLCTVPIIPALQSTSSRLKLRLAKSCCLGQSVAAGFQVPTIKDTTLHVVVTPFLMGIEAFGIEADPNVKAVVDRYNLNVHIGSIHDCPFPDRQFDLITLNQVIEHVPDPLLLLQEVSRRLRHGGRVALSFPNVSSLQRRLAGRRWINWHVPYHQHHFNLHSFQQLALQAGFKIVTMRTITPNLWTLLQIRVSLSKSSEGQASLSWSSEPTLPQGRISFFRRCWNRLAWHLRGLPNLVLTAWNRSTDMLRLGDSILVVIQQVDTIRS
jgi:SAM-dependent methyltransferase